MIRLLEFHRSSNCAKVRVALGYKGLPFVAEEMSSADRSPIVEAAGWPLVPVILDGDVRMRDSEAILHYLESNYLDRPSLTPARMEDLKKGDAILQEARAALRPILRRVFAQALRAPGERQATALGDLVSELEPALAPLEAQLAGRAFLLGDRMSYFDVLLACTLTPFVPRADYAAQSPLWAFFAANLSLPETLGNVPAWMDRVLAYDGNGAADR